MLWLIVAAVWCVGYYLQESWKLEGDASITSRMGIVEGSLVNGYGGGKGSVPRWYVLTYRYGTSATGMLEQDVTFPADQLGRLGLNRQGVSDLYSHPRPWIVEFYARDPTISRLRGLAYHGGSSAATLWTGLGVGGFVGIFGFLVLISTRFGARRDSYRT